MFINENNNVRTCSGIVLWDGITSPDQNDDGSVSHNLKIAIPENAAEKAELEQLATNTLNSSEFKGVLPVNGNWPVTVIDVSKLGESAPLMAGRVAITGKTRRGVPPVYDANGQVLSAMQFGQMIYPGAVVELLVHSYSYNNKQKGIGFGLDGIMIVDATAPKLDVGVGMGASQVAAAFGAPAGTPVVQAQAQAGGVTTPPPQQNTGFVVNAGQPGAVVPPPAETVLHVMTAKAQGMTYEAAIGAGWDDEKLIANGMMQA